MIRKGYIVNVYGGEINVDELDILATMGAGDDEEFVTRRSGTIWSSAGDVGKKNTAGLDYITVLPRKPDPKNFKTDFVLLTLDEVKEEVIKQTPTAIVNARRQIKNGSHYLERLLASKTFDTLPKDEYTSIFTGKTC